MVDITDWAVFARAAELSSLSAAGRDLRMSAAVVSNRIAKLEKHLGVRLLNRTTRRVNLTEEGALFYEHCIRILNEIEQIETNIAARREQPRGVLTVSAPVAFGRLHIAPHVPAFVERFPEMQIRLHLTDRLIDIVNEGADLAIRIADLKNYSFIVRKLAANRRVIVASPSYLEAHGTPRTPQDLLDHNCLLLRFPGSQQFQWSLEGDEGIVTLPVSGSMDSDNGEVLREWCLDGIGLALKSLWEIGPDLKAGRLKVVLPAWRPPSHAVYALYPHSRYLPPRVRAFIDFLLETYGPKPYWEKGIALPKAARRMGPGKPAL